MRPRRRSWRNRQQGEGTDNESRNLYSYSCLALVAALAGLAAPSAAQEWYSARTASELPVGSTPWWQAMDREGRGGNAAINYALNPAGLECTGVSARLGKG